MRTWSFADAITGQFVGTTFSTYSANAEAVLAANTREGQIPVEGSFDHLSQRFDLASGEVIDWIPPAPDGDHEWSEATRRWVKRADVLEREAQRTQAQARIEALERKQLRPMRELQLNPANVDAAARLAEIDAEIAELRESL